MALPWDFSDGRLTLILPHSPSSLQVDFLQFFTLVGVGTVFVIDLIFHLDPLTGRSQSGEKAVNLSQLIGKVKNGT